jgi:glycerophosphoryl diester phosphodiesterase
MPTTKPIIVAHRGLHRSCPENSLAAFMAAAEAGIPWVECDVWPSADGEPFIIHDETVDRTTPGTGPVVEYPSDQLRLLGLPSLGDLIKTLPVEMGILVEIKPPGPRPIEPRPFLSRVVSELSSRHGPWMYQSFHLQNILFPIGPMAFLTDNAELLRGILESDCIVHPQHSLIDQPMVDSQHARNKTIGAWTVNTPADIQRMISIGVDMIITDEPELAMRMIATRSP